jgi:hypothetical protein
MPFLNFIFKFHNTARQRFGGGIFFSSNFSKKVSTGSVEYRPYKFC